MSEPDAARAWLENSFNRVIIANWAPCPECGAAPSQPCRGEVVVGTYAHVARVAAGIAVLRDEITP